MTIPKLIPFAIYKPIHYKDEAGKFTRDPLGLILHVQQGDHSPYEWFNGLRSPNRAFSHFWIAKTGKLEQYTTTDRRSWAMRDGDRAYLSVETEGYTTEPLTKPQGETLAALCRILGVRKKADTPGVRGLGTHGMGGFDWGNHPGCPGKLRAAQRDLVLEVRLPDLHPEPHAPVYPGLLYLGSRGTAVLKAQRRFQSRGWKLKADGVFGPITERIVSRFQLEKELERDGVIGPRTWVALWRR